MSSDKPDQELLALAHWGRARFMSSFFSGPIVNQSGSTSLSGRVTNAAYRIVRALVPMLAFSATWSFLSRRGGSQTQWNLDEDFGSAAVKLLADPVEGILNLASGLPPLHALGAALLLLLATGLVTAPAFSRRAVEARLLSREGDSPFTRRCLRAVEPTRRAIVVTGWLEPTLKATAAAILASVGWAFSGGIRGLPQIPNWIVLLGILVSWWWISSALNARVEQAGKRQADITAKRLEEEFLNMLTRSRRRRS